MKIFRIHFEDCGQDFLNWDVDIITGRVVDCRPFQAGIWCKCTVVNVDDLQVGGKVDFETGDEMLTMKYPICELEALEVFPDQYQEG